MQITGTVDTVLQPVERNGFTSRKMWVKIDETSQYPQIIEVECGGKQSNLFDGIKENDSVTLDINLRGRKWEGNGKISVFNTLSVWKVAKAQSGHGALQNGSLDAGSDGVDPLPF